MDRSHELLAVADMDMDAAEQEVDIVRIVQALIHAEQAALGYSGVEDQLHLAPYQIGLLNP